METYIETSKLKPGCNTCGQSVNRINSLARAAESKLVVVAVEVSVDVDVVVVDAGWRSSTALAKRLPQPGASTGANQTTSLGLLRSVSVRSETKMVPRSATTG